MATIPVKSKKPVPPPKPPSRLSGGIQGHADHEDTANERCLTHHGVSTPVKVKDDHLYDEIEACGKDATKRLPNTDEVSPSGTWTARGGCAGATAVASGDSVTGVKPVYIEEANCKKILNVKPPLLPKPLGTHKLLDHPSILNKKLALSRLQKSQTLPIQLVKDELPFKSTTGITKTINTESQSQHSSQKLQVSFNKEKKVGLPPLSIKAPIGTFEEFETFDLARTENPVRPPRSPKTQPFKDEPFKPLDEGKPKLPLKLKQLHSPPTSPKLTISHNVDTSITADWDLQRQKSASLGRNNVILSEIKIKSASLGRNQIEDGNLVLRKKHFLITKEESSPPVPPPRRRKKSLSDLSPTIQSLALFIESNEQGCVFPVYSKVNYNMKKNRRQPLEITQTCSMQEDIVVQDNPSVDKLLFEDNNKHEIAKDLKNNFLTLNGNTSRASSIIGSNLDNDPGDNKSDNSANKSEEISVGGDIEIKNEPAEVCSNLVNSSIILKDKLLHATAQSIQIDETLSPRNVTCTETTDSDSSGRNITLNNCIVTDKTWEPTSVTYDGEQPASAQVSVSSCSQVVQHHEEEKCSDSCADWSSATDAVDSVASSKLDWKSAKHSLHSSDCDFVPVQQHAGIVKINSELYRIIREKSHTEVSSNQDLTSIIQESVIDVLPYVDTNIKTTETVFQCLHKETKEGDITETCKFNLEGSVHTLHEDVKQAPVQVCDSNTLAQAAVLVNVTKGGNIPSSAQQGDISSGASNVHSQIFRTCSLPHGSKLYVKEMKKGVFRRQSWSNYRCDSLCLPHDENAKSIVGLRKRKQKGMSLWCDEGELSSGALADLDSSDNTARQSSVEDVVDSDADDARTPVRDKITSWFSSLGKGNRKSKDKNVRLSQFYAPDDSSETDNVASQEEKHLNVKVNSEVAGASVVEGIPKILSQSPSLEVVERNGNTVPHDVNRPASGLSETLDCLDVDQKSDAPVSEDSFEAGMHSESENDEDGDADACSRSISLEQHKEKQAFFIAQELMTSEKVFIDVLKLLSMDFKKAVESAGIEQRSSVIPESDLKKIISILPQLQHLNEDLLYDLDDRIRNWSSSQKISDVIVKKGPFLKLYTAYIQNFEAQCGFLDECCQKYPRFLKVVKDFEASTRCQKLSLKHYMLKPVQRIPQYRLLLDDYLHHLEPNSPDFEDTRTALKIVCDVADHANRSIQLGDNLRKLLELQSRLDKYEIIKPGREFIKEGELCKLSRNRMQPRYFILLNDCLLYMSYNGSVAASGLRVNYELPLTGMKVAIQQVEDYRNEFSIISTMRSFTLLAQSSEECQHWVDVLQRAIKENVSRQLTFKQRIPQEDEDNDKGSLEKFKLGRSAPVWIQDHRVTRCQCCTAEFTVTFRRHHCRACGKVVCGNCSDNRAPLQYKNFEAVRVCEECYETLLKEFEDPSSNISGIVKSVDGIRNSFEHMRSQFKKLGTTSAKKVKYIPQRLKEVTANDTGSQMSGWLQWRVRRSWKSYWFVLKEQVLYVYKASEDVVALQSIPVLGYNVESLRKSGCQLYEGVDAKLIFQLVHKGQSPLMFHADNEHLANRWIAAMLEGTVLK